VETAAIVQGILARLTPALAAPRGTYLPLSVEHRIVGWIDAARVGRLEAFKNVFDAAAPGIAFAAALADSEARTAALDRVARTLAAEGRLSAWRDERYSVAESFGAQPLFVLERAAARFFGIATFAAHVNGLVRRDGEIRMWLARRSARKAIDPNLLDNLVGGGIAAGTTVPMTVIKEAWEEAGIPGAIAARAECTGTVQICRAQPEGLQRETIFVHDLWLDADFVPANQDGEAVEHRQMPLADAARLVANESGDEVVTADASLVIVDCLLRHGFVAPGSRDYRALDALRHAARDPPGETPVST
jgi:8-oxo-dGTP pyrophosphatase MutT (NUDIX family)